MEILVSGSLAYDRIMDFTGRFSEHIMAGQIDNINVSFTVDGMTENFGGTAGNIAYALALLGEKPRILAAIGSDYHRYYHWLDQHGLATGDIKIVTDEFTASAYITTDEADNQITVFNPGAMKYSSGFESQGQDLGNCIAIVAPGNLGDMSDYSKLYQEKGGFSIFDPGQSLPAWSGDALADCIGRSRMLICNDYEMGMIINSTGLSQEELLGRVESIIVTKGEEGCQLLHGREVVTIPVVPTANVVDPTGAGDAFRGGLIKGMVEGLTVHRAAEMGTVCAHFAVQKQGTQEYSFDMDQFDAILHRQFGS